LPPVPITSRIFSFGTEMMLILGAVAATSPRAPVSAFAISPRMCMRPSRACARACTRAGAGTLSRDEAARAARKPSASNPSSTPVRRVACRLSGGRTLTLAGAGLHLDALIDTLEEVLKEARKARGQNWDVATLAKVFRHRAAKGGAE